MPRKCSCAPGRDDDDAPHDSAELAASTFLMHLTDPADKVWIVADLIRLTDAKQTTGEDAIAMLVRDGLAVCSGALIVPTRAAIRGDKLAL
jgi:hypothetical protein